jgi:hypothetical protein
MNLQKFLVLALTPLLICCKKDYVDTALTSDDWLVKSVEERRNFKWHEAQGSFPISSIRFHSDRSLSIYYLGDSTLYEGDWNDYFQDVNCPDNDCNDMHLVVLNLYHSSPLPTVFEVTKLRSNVLTMVSDEEGNKIRFQFSR